ncbi:uncharacterized protein LOC124665685 [Lolium rigidum]|uniref:uncharacterized protein LOC124665685 n=1 Tax=Lolium rigidum TaxID=89674 RepID=UPI001F5E339D|nr:uncharacterized protein LOC124665685 [Lolium rigidum]
MVAATSRHAGVSGEKEQYNYTIELMAMLGVFGAVINIIQMSYRDYQLTATSLANMPQLHWEICHTALFLSEKNCILLNGMLVLQLATASSLANRPQCDLWRDELYRQVAGMCSSVPTRQAGQRCSSFSACHSCLDLKHGMKRINFPLYFVLNILYLFLSHFGFMFLIQL